MPPPNNIPAKYLPGKQIASKDTQVVALRFLELERLDANNDHLVTTDIIMGRDTISKTLALDKLSTIYPATNAKTDSSVKMTNTKEIIATNTKKTAEPESEEPIARSTNANGVRQKKTRDEQ